jgi:hypothetical protein
MASLSPPRPIFHTIPFNIRFQSNIFEILSGCRCVRFVSTFGKEWGSFGSPDFPAAYPSGIPCFLYLFTSPPEFIVQLNFSHIHLPTSPNGYVNTLTYSPYTINFFLSLSLLWLGQKSHGMR